MPQIIPIEFNQIERPKKHVRVVTPMRDPIEGCNAIFTTCHRLTIDNAGPHPQPGERLDNKNEAMREVVARAAIKPHLLVDLAGDYPEAIVLDFMQPQRPGSGSVLTWGGMAL